METLSFRVSEEWYAGIKKAANEHNTTQAAVLRALLEMSAGKPFPEDFPEKYEKATAPELAAKGEL